ncbi:ABC transporter ATP-binding protein [Boseaceae bacterium BT-24-1]|nr:ABC transporter ATP-binding protein [Boseaceae bacterium BT-24-1]
MLKGVDLQVGEGTVHAVIGPNGAGKTTLVNIITGVHSPSAGSIRFAGEQVASLSVHQRARRGLARTFQITNLFGDLTVRENISVALAGARRHRFKRLSDAELEYARSTTVEELLGLVGLQAASEVKAEILSHGDQRLLEVAVALACQPKMLLLDEPSAGMSPAETQAFISLVNTRLRGRVTIVLIEHDMAVVMGTADRICVLAGGSVLADGMPSEIMQNTYVKEAYLGRA